MTVRRAFAMVLMLGAAGCRATPEDMHAHEPVTVTSPLMLAGAVVEGASRGWYREAGGPPRHGDPVPVVLTSYCLKGKTRQGRYVRPGIIAADPRFFPLSRHVEVYVGREFYGRFLVDDTGGKIKGNRLDVWMPDCREAVRFGVRRGTAVLVPGPVQARQAGAPR